MRLDEYRIHQKYARTSEHDPTMIPAESDFPYTNESYEWRKMTYRSSRPFGIKHPKIRFHRQATVQYMHRRCEPRQDTNHFPHESDESLSSKDRHIDLYQEYQSPLQS